VACGGQGRGQASSPAGGCSQSSNKAGGDIPVGERAHGRVGSSAGERRHRICCPSSPAGGSGPQQGRGVAPAQGRPPRRRRFRSRCSTSVSPLSSLLWSLRGSFPLRGILMRRRFRKIGCTTAPCMPRPPWRTGQDRRSHEMTGTCVLPNAGCFFHKHHHTGACWPGGYRCRWVGTQAMGEKNCFW
jgi:hypothetical protein